MKGSGMATRVVKETICDMCGREATATYRITRQRTSRQVDLCDEHGGPLEDMLEHAKRQGRTPRRREVLTMEEVAARRRK